MRLTWALLVNGFGSPRKLTKMTPQMHLGQNDSGNEGFSAKPITCNHWSESLYEVFRIKCVHSRYLFLKATESNTIYFHYVLIPPSFQGSWSHTFLFIFLFLAVVMWSRGWQTDYKGRGSKLFWTPWAEWSLPQLLSCIVHKQPQTLCKWASLGVFQQIFTYKNRQWNWFVVKLLDLSPPLLPSLPHSHSQSPTWVSKKVMTS